MQSQTDSQSAPHSRSRVDLSNHRFTTARYGFIYPFFNMEAVPGDNVNMTSSHSIRSTSLKSPLMSDVYMSKDFFAVPMEAIIPNAWSRIITNPTVGDDLPKFGHLPSARISRLSPLSNNGDRTEFETTIRSIMGATAIDDGSQNKSQPLGYLFNMMNFLSHFYSRGSLLARFNINIWSMLKSVTVPKIGGSKVVMSFDGFYDYLYSKLKAYLVNGGYTSLDVYYAKLSASDVTGTFMSFMKSPSAAVDDYGWIDRAFDFMTEHYVFAINFNKVGGNTFANIGEIFDIDKDANIVFDCVAANGNCAYLNLAPLAAYQIVCAHYYTNDKIDDIYSAELYRQMMFDLAFRGSTSTYTYNNTSYVFDGLSGTAIHKMLQTPFPSFGVSLSQSDVRYKTYVMNFFGFNRSLKFQDYFTGSRVRPLGVGNTDVNVTSNKVSIIDTTKSIQMQRFLNLVNKTGRKFEEYTGKLFGTYVAPDYHNPSYLGRIRDKVVTYETENTGEAQQTQAVSVTAQFSSNGNNYSFNFDSDRFQVVLGLVSFDIQRVYCRTLDRNCFHNDRFEYFNPMMQFTGDQPVYRLELSADAQGPSDDTAPLAFGYQVRHAEYKCSYPTASGAFLLPEGLSTWQFLADFEDYYRTDTVNSEYIRSKSTELDKFFIALFGYSQASRYHFICDFVNDVKASRPMVVNPNIL